MFDKQTEDVSGEKDMETLICSIRPENFNEEVLAEEKPLLIGCLARDDSYERQLKILSNVAGEYRKRLKVGLLAQDTLEICKKKLQITGSPTFILMKGGREISRVLGISDQAMLVHLIELHLPGSSVDVG